MKTRIAVFLAAISCFLASQKLLAQAEKLAINHDFAAGKTAVALGAVPKRSQVSAEEISLPLWRPKYGGFQNALPHFQESSSPLAGANLYLAPTAANTGTGEHYHYDQHSGVYASDRYQGHPSAIIINGPTMPVAERKLLYWASQTGMRFLGRRTGTYATGSHSEISAASLSHSSEQPRRAGSSPR